ESGWEVQEYMLPGLARVGGFWNAPSPYSAPWFKEKQAAGRALGIEVQSLEVRAPHDLDGAFEAARRQSPGRVDYGGSPSHRHLSKAHCRLRGEATPAGALWS